MEIILQSGRVIMKSGGVGTQQDCCCKTQCTETGVGSGGAGTTVNTHEFPLTEEEVYFSYDAFYIPDSFTVKACGDTLLSTGSISGYGRECLTKPEGCDSLEVTVEGPEGTAWWYGYQCGCPPPPPPIVCCKPGPVCVDPDGGPGAGQYLICGSCTEEQISNGEGYPEPDCAGSPRTLPDRRPFDCFGQTHLSYLFGAFIEVSDWDPFVDVGIPAEDLDDHTVVLLNRVKQLMNSTYFAEWSGCLAFSPYLTSVYNFTGPTVTIGEESYATQWEVLPELDMCSRIVSLTVAEVNYGLASLTASSVDEDGRARVAETPCNHSGCYCSIWTAKIYSSLEENGQFTVG